ncbi:MAG: 7-cyano-7-deazaguanine synthase [Candidatus Methylomirabilales bacterium]
MPQRSLVLVSGGVDSSTLLARELKEGFDVLPLHIDYGQRGARMERLSCEAQARVHGLTVEILDASSLGQGFRQRARKDRDVPFPHRNLVILAIAVSYAHERFCTRICLSVNRDDTQDHPAATEAFIESFRATAATLDKRFAIATPLITLPKHEVVLLGASLGVDFSKTYSCFLGREWHCGSCGQCVIRKAAFSRAGMGEPEGFYRE